MVAGLFLTSFGWFNATSIGNIEYGSINIYCYRDSILKFRYRGERGALVPETADDLCLEDDPETEGD